MPRKDKEARLAYQREWYAKNSARVIAKVTERKRTQYVGTCRNCGGVTHGNTPKKIPEWCGKRECASAQRRADHKPRVKRIAERGVWKERKSSPRTVKAKKSSPLQDGSWLYGPNPTDSSTGLDRTQDA